MVWKGGVQVKTQEKNAWAGEIRHDWARYRKVYHPLKRKRHIMKEFSEMTVATMNLWLCKFFMEVRRKDAKPYLPDTLFQTCCGLLQLVKEAD